MSETVHIEAYLHEINAADLVERRRKCFEQVREISKSLAPKNRKKFLQDFERRFVNKRRS